MQEIDEDQLDKAHSEDVAQKMLNLETTEEQKPMADGEFNKLLNNTKPEQYRFPAHMNRKARRNWIKKFRRLK